MATVVTEADIEPRDPLDLTFVDCLPMMEGEFQLQPQEIPHIETAIDTCSQNKKAKKNLARRS